MIDLTLLPDGGMHWLDASGPKGHIVLSTRIRLARNIHGFAFGQRAGDEDRLAVLARVQQAAAATPIAGGVTFRMDQLERLDRPGVHGRAPGGEGVAAPEGGGPPGGGAGLGVPRAPAGMGD